MFPRLIMWSLLAASYCSILITGGLAGWLTAGLLVALLLFFWRICSSAQKPFELEYSPDPQLFDSSPEVADGPFFVLDHPPRDPWRIPVLVMNAWLASAFLLLAVIRLMVGAAAEWRLIISVLFIPPILARNILETFREEPPLQPRPLPDSIRRPPFDIDSADDRNKLSRYWNDSAEAAVALELAKLFRINRFFYPEDFFLFFTGSSTKAFAVIGEHFKIPFAPSDCQRATFRGLLYALACRLRLQDTVTFPDKLPQGEPEQRLRSPEALRQLINPKYEQGREWHDADFIKVLRDRPAFSLRKFYACWPDPESARIALVFRDFSVVHFKRPDDAMFYPDDPMPLLFQMDQPDLDYDDYADMLGDLFKLKLKETEIITLFRETDLAGAVGHILNQHPPLIAPKQSRNSGRNQ